MTERMLFGLVLAGGESRRMGRDKALLDHGGQSQLAYAVSVVDSCAERTFVSMREAQRDDPERARFEQIVDRYDGIGPVAGILSALEAWPAVDWLVVACDLPNISVDAIRHLLAADDGEHPFTAYISTHDGLPEPLCAIYRAGCADIVRGFVDQGMHCPRKMLIRSDTQLVQQASPDSLDNVNTPDDLRGSVLRANR